MSTPNEPNNGCTMLITRPKHQAVQLVELVQSSGGKAYSFPTIEIRPTCNHSALFKIIKTLPKCDYVFFISPNAVTHGIGAISKAIGTLPESVKIAGIGAGTIAALDAAGYQCHVSPRENFNSEALLLLPELQDIRDKQVVIFRGNGGRDKLRNELKKRGAHVEYAECYERVIPETDIKPLVSELESNNIDIISFTSADAAGNLVAMLGKYADYVFSLPVIVISQRIADVCQSLGFKTGMLLAKAATNEAIIDCMKAWQQEKNYNK